MKKKAIEIFSVGSILVLLLCGSAMAYSVTYGDSYANWPGYSGIAIDEIPAAPQISSMTITTNNGFLTEVQIREANREHFVGGGHSVGGFFDSLFINSNYGVADNNYQSWDWYVKDETYDNGLNGAGLYQIASYAYTYPAPHSGRVYHPNGIDVSGLTPTTGILLGVDYDGAVLTYSFAPGIYVGDRFLIGYTVQCSNDVFLTPVPEPATMLLLGTGLVGLAGFGRRRFFKKG